jgi:hypothetical protein
MDVKEFDNLLESIVSSEIKKTILKESVDNKHEVYHVKCEGEPIETCQTEDEANEVVDKLKKEHPGKQFIIEKTMYESHEDMIDKLDEMGQQLEEKENQDMKNTQVDEKLVGKQSKLDKNHNGKIDGQDFKIMQGQQDEEEECVECGQSMEEEEVTEEKECCKKCGKEMCECGGMYESKKKTVRLTESQLAEMIAKMVSESMPGLEAAKKAHKESGKQNKEAIADMMNDVEKAYLSFDNNDKPEFPNQLNSKTKKVAYSNTKDQDEETAKNFAGLQNLEYDLEPSEAYKKRQKMAIEGDVLMGNAPVTEKPSIKPTNGAPMGKEAKEKQGNHIPTPETAKKMEKQIKDREKDKEDRVIYPKEKVPVNESKISLSSVLLEEMNKMKKLSSYNKKTQ